VKAWFSNLTMKSLALAFAIAIAAHAETIRSISTFATGQAVNATGPDSITVGGARFGSATRMARIRPA
jgi:hypothetical protein